MVIKVNKTKDFTVMSNYHLKDKRISLKAKGLLSVMLSLPDTWDYSIDGLVAICKENRSAVESTLEELKANGYLIVTKLYPNQSKSGRIEYIYDIYEKPKQEGAKQALENLPLETLPIESQPIENQRQYNTYRESTIQSNTHISSTHKSVERFTPPTVSEVADYCRERNNNVDPERFVDYYTSNGWMVGKVKMKDWKSAVRTWERSAKKETEKPFGDNIFANIGYMEAHNGTARGY